MPTIPRDANNVASPVADGGGNAQTLLVQATGADSLSPAALSLDAIARQHVYDDVAGVWVRARANTATTLLASAARTASASCPVQTNETATGLLLFLAVTAASGTGGLQPVIQAVDPISGAGCEYAAPTAFITAAGTYAWLLHPGASAAAPGPGAGLIQQYIAAALARQWEVFVRAGDGSAYTYALSAHLLR